jgi:hypothetical protein
MVIHKLRIRHKLCNSSGESDLHNSWVEFGSEVDSDLVFVSEFVLSLQIFLFHQSFLN